MRYTVYKPLNDDREFQAYLDLLAEKNIDISRLERIREKGSDRKWLYAWPTREAAEQFAIELRQRLRDDEFRVVEFEPDDGRSGIEIDVHEEAEGRTFRLSKDAISKIQGTFPGTNPVPSIFIGNDTFADYERQNGSIDSQIIILLTSLSIEQLDTLGGVSFRYFSGETLNPSTYESAPSEYSVRAEAVASEIDKLACTPDRFSYLLNRLISLTLTQQPWSPEIEVNPFRGGVEGQFWLWNLAGSRLIQDRRFKDACELFASQYFSMVTLQILFGHRYHKGMPLCNIGVALSLAGDVELAKLSWILGLIEDSVTNRPTASKQSNYKNLLPHLKSQLKLNSFIEMADRFVREFGVIPIVPEAIVIQCLDPLQQATPETAIRAIGGLFEAVHKSFPMLFPGPYMDRLKEFWGQIGFRRHLEAIR